MNSRGRQLMILAALAAAVVLFIVLSDSGEDGDGDTTVAEQTPTATTPTAPPEPPVETIEMRNGAPVGGVRELTYSKGEQVRIKVTLDQPQEDVHIHGYDIERLNPTKSASFDFPAKIEGIFELEAHGPDGDVVLAEIRVEPS